MATSIYWTTKEVKVPYFVYWYINRTLVKDAAMHGSNAPINGIPGADVGERRGIWHWNLPRGVGT